MTASDSSLLGFAKQTALGTPNTTDASFKYLLFNEGGMGPENRTLPLDPEVGGGAMLRDVVKVGVLSRGQIAFIPRPDTLGNMLLGATGNVVSTDNTTHHTHVFTLGANQFAAPYYTFRSSPGALWGEQFQDCRFSALSLAWRGANFVRGEAAMMGGLPTRVSPTTWGAAPKTDGGPQFLAPVSNISVPTGTDLKVISGAFSMGMNIPMDEQWVTGSYSPDAFDITQRAFQLSLVVKITDDALYKKAMYNPASGNDWAAAMFREADIDLNLKSSIEAATGIPYSLNIQANGASDATANVVWSAQTIAMRPGRQITMALSGTFLADPNGGEPLTLTLVNQTPSY